MPESSSYTYTNGISLFNPLTLITKLGKPVSDI